MRPEHARIAYFTPVFGESRSGPPDWIAEELRRRGADVAVITGVPGVLQGRAQPGYRAWRPLIESQHGFRTLRSPLYISHDSSALRRIATYATLASSTSVLGHGVGVTADIGLVYASQITLALPAMVAKCSSGTPYIMIIQDLWPDSIFATGFVESGVKRRAIDWIAGAFCRLAYSHAAHISVITPGMRETLIARGVPHDKVSLVYNWADEGTYFPTESTGELRGRIGADDADTILLYAGNHGFAQGLSAWIEAMGLVRDLPGIRLVLVGDGPAKAQLRELAWASSARDKIHLIDPIAGDQLNRWAADAAATIISLANDPLFEITLPGKTQVNLAMGRPILASAAGDLRRVVEDSGAGWVAEPEDPADIARVIREAASAGSAALDSRGVRGRAFYNANMSARIGGNAYAEMVDTWLPRQGSRH